MAYKHRGKEIVLDDDGKLRCSYLGLIADTLPEMKKLINAEMKSDSKKTDRVAVLILSRNGGKVGEGMMGAKDGMRYWVSYKIKGEEKVRREKIYYSEIYLDTPENRSVIDQIAENKRQRDELNKQYYDLTEKLKSVKE